MLTPLYDRVIIEPIIRERTESGLFLPGIDEKLAKAKVIIAGNGHWEFGSFVEMSVKPGDIVLYNVAAAHDIEDSDNKKYKVLRETEIVAIIT